MSNNKVFPAIDDVREKVEEYETTIMALQAISQIIISKYPIEKNSKKINVSIGRMMSTSNTNRIKPANSVTPDIIIQIGDAWGMVGEVKRSMPLNLDDRWKNTVKQIEKYDDTLQGWWTQTGNLSESNVALLIEVDRSVEFSRYLQSLIDAKEIQDFNNPTSIIEFFKKQEVKQFLHIRKIWGKIIPSDLQDFLESGKSISVEGLIDRQRFYDSEPEVVEYTMVLLWQNVFNKLRMDSKFDENQKAWLIEINSGELTEYLQKLYGNMATEHRERTFPRKKWIVKALNAFVELGLATSTQDRDIFIIKFRKLSRGDIFEKFYKHRNIKSKKSGDIKQLELFPTEKIIEDDDIIEE
jgi:hypothetical protein